jgi:spermidine synthase
LPLIIHNGEPRSALVIGLGTGITAGSLLRFPELERRVGVELLPAVVRAAPLFQGNFGAASDPSLEVRIRDGRRELLSNPEQYDLITLEPPPPTATGIVNLYSSDFYRLAGSRLRQGGLLAQWWPLPTQNDEDSRALVRSFLDVFPHVSLWTTELHEMLLIGSFEPIALDVPRIVARFEQPEVSVALREVGIASPAALLATWVTDRSGLERYVDGAPPVTDDRPCVEYATWVRPKEFGRVLPRLLALRSMPPLRDADEAFSTAVADERDRLLAFYEAGLHAYHGEREPWARGMRRVMRQDGGNPYYRWFVGGAR